MQFEQGASDMKNWMRVGAALVALLDVTAAKAGHIDLPYRMGVAVQSKANGLAQNSLQILERAAAPGRAAVMAQLLSRFAPTGTNAIAANSPIIRTDADFAMATGDGWFLEVRGEGDWIRYRNHGYITGPKNKTISTEAKPAVSTLESLARNVVKNELAPFVQLAAGEELQAWTASYLASMSTDATGIVNREVAASRIIFTRVIDGVPVLGSGSKVSVILANDGTLVGFDVDWPALKRSVTRAATVDIGTIRKRADQALGIGAGAKRPEERVFECGYYDPGVQGATAGASVGPACVVIVDPNPGAAGFLTKIIVPIEAS